MPRITRVYTRTGDDGSTALAAGGRIGKDSLRVACYGTVDELNAAIGVALARDMPEALTGSLTAIQNDLFHLGADLAVPEVEKAEHPMPRIEERHVVALERMMDEWLERLAPLENFVLPGGTPAAAALHAARTICRRAEREAVALARVERVGRFTVPFLNRLSDALFVLARAANALAGRPDVLWDTRR